jgi:pyrimidine-nucleoside phosphorylase
VSFPTVEFILHKRDGNSHTPEDIRAFCRAYLEGDIPDYQAAAWLMAVYFNGLDVAERAALTDATVHSGETLELSALELPKVDKHSTGGVGDKTSLVLVPLLASLDVCVPMMSGRGLGHTGGTLDKLEAIPGMRVELPLADYERILHECHGAFMAQTAKMAPLDKKLYALRDVTGTVESIGLITASIIGKKATEDLDGLVIDCKFGSGAFMKTLNDARALARALVDTAKTLGIRTTALLTNMHEPLGAFIGNAVEVREALHMLRHEPVEQRLREVTLTLATEMYRLAYPEQSETDARARLEQQLANGAAYEHMLRILAAQGVPKNVLNGLPDSLPVASHTIPIRATRSGLVHSIATSRLGRLLARLRAGRLTLEDTIDPVVGLHSHVTVGSRVRAGEPLGVLHVREDIDPSELAECFVIADDTPTGHPLIAERIT